MSSVDNLIHGLLSADNAVRTLAEQQLEAARQQPDNLVNGLLQSLRTSPEEPVRIMAGSVLRPILLVNGKKSLMESISPQTIDLVKRELLMAIEMDASPKVRRKLEDMIAELGSALVPQNRWPELLPFMFKCTQSPSEHVRESALSIFGTLAQYLQENFRPYFQTLKDIFRAGLTDAASFKVRVAAMHAMATFLQILSTPDERKPFQELIPFMLNTVKEALENKMEDEAIASLELLVGLAEVESNFFKNSLDLLLDSMLMFASAAGLNDNVRHLALEVLITLVEARPGLVKTHHSYVARLLQVVFNYMLTVQDDADWNSKSDQDEEQEITDHMIGEEALDRMALRLKGKALVPLLFQAIPALIASPSWNQRYVALMAVSFASEGCASDLEPHVEQLVNMVVTHIRDPHPRVRWAALQALGQMCSDYRPDFQVDHASKVLPAIVIALDDVENPRVQAHAASAIVNFCEDCEAETLTPYLDGLLGKLITMISASKIIVQEQVITAIASIAESAGEQFGRYYDSFVPFLKTVLINTANRKEYLKLRGKAIECLSLIGVAVGKVKFAQDAQEVMNAMINTKLEPEDPQAPFILNSWTRIGQCLGNDFVPYLPYVIPPLIATASVKTESHVADSEVPDREGWDYVTFGDKKVGIHTNTLEDKSDACNMLFCYAENMKEGFYPYADEVSKLMVPLLLFYYHEGVRISAASSLGPLLVCVRDFMAKNAPNGAEAMYVRNMLDFMWPKPMEAIAAETDNDVLYSMLEAAIEMMTAAGPGALSADRLKEVGTTLCHLLHDVYERREDRDEQRKSQDYIPEDEEDLDDDEKSDQDILQEVAEVVGQVFKFNTDAFIPYFMGIGLIAEDASDVARNEGGCWKIALELIQPNKSATDKKAGLCILDDMMEFCGASVLQLYQNFIPLVIQYALDTDPTVRQAAVYGMGQCARFAGEHFTTLCPIVVQGLTNAIASQEARTDDFITATENAISALGKVIDHHPQMVVLPQLLTSWLTYLPVTEDKIESKVVYALLCTFIEKHGSILLGNGFANLPKVLSIFGQVLETDLIDEPLTARMSQLLKTMRGSIPADAFNNAATHLPEDQRNKLMKALA
eukprot:TRINITY_DN1085_c0_g1_i2.p1 TRINITY_DN1085_c0_g1~~TRINITY_DN1085_c0_g1_i2.p1  ORF type:complete len:1100 (+),score=314.59 TRINITY_DN1085_c0_g1_i2:117-3416(+)